MRIHTDIDGRYVNAISMALAENVEGSLYYLQAANDSTVLQFQKGPVAVNVNGITNEMLVAVLLHRIAALDAKFPCTENTLALTALGAVQSALTDRQARVTA